MCTLGVISWILSCEFLVNLNFSEKFDFWLNGKSAVGVIWWNTIVFRLHNIRTKFDKINKYWRIKECKIKNLYFLTDCYMQAVEFFQMYFALKLVIFLSFSLYMSVDGGENVWCGFFYCCWVGTTMTYLVHMEWFHKIIFNNYGGDEPEHLVSDFTFGACKAEISIVEQTIE